MKAGTAGINLRGILNLAGGSAIGQLAVLGVAPLWARLFRPEELGQFGLLQAFVGFAAVGVCLRLDLAIVSADSEADANGLLQLCLTLCVVLSLVATAALGILVASNLMGFGSLEPWALVAAFGLLLLTGTFIVLRFWAVRMRQYRCIAGALTLQGVGRAVFPVAFGMVSAGWGGLVAGELAGRALGIRSLGRMAWQRLRDRCHRRTTTCRLFAKYRQYWAVILPSSVLDALALALPVPVIAATYGLEAAGWWVLVNRVAMAPGQLIAAAVADVFHTEAMRQLSADPAGARRWLWSTSRPLLIGSLAVYACAGTVAPWAFAFIFGPEWTTAGWLLMLLVPAMVITVVVGATGRMLMVMNRSHWKLLADILNVAAPPVAFYVGVASDWTFLQASAAFGLAYMLANVVYFTAIWHSTSPALRS